MRLNCFKSMENTYQELPTSPCPHDDKLWCHLLLPRSHWSTLLQANVQNTITLGKDSFGSIHHFSFHSWILSYITPELLRDRLPLLLPLIWRFLHQVLIHYRNLAMGVLHHMAHALFRQQEIQWRRLCNSHWLRPLRLCITLFLYHSGSCSNNPSIQTGVHPRSICRNAFSERFHPYNLCTICINLYGCIPSRWQGPKRRASWAITWARSTKRWRWQKRR